MNVNSGDPKKISDPGKKRKMGVFRVPHFLDTKKFVKITGKFTDTREHPEIPKMDENKIYLTKN